MPVAIQPVQPTEPFTVFHAVALKAALLEALDAHANGLVLDLSIVDEIDTAGVQLLLMLRREAAERGCGLFFSALSPPVREILDLFGLAGEFPVDDVMKPRGAGG